MPLGPADPRPGGAGKADGQRQPERDHATGGRRRRVALTRRLDPRPQVPTSSDERFAGGMLCVVVLGVRFHDRSLSQKEGIGRSASWPAAQCHLGAIQGSLICLLKTEHDLKAVTREVTSRLVGRAA